MQNLLRSEQIMDGVLTKHLPCVKHLHYCHSKRNSKPKSVDESGLACRQSAPFAEVAHLMVAGSDEGLDEDVRMQQ